jgi:hypothetical protein
MNLVYAVERLLDTGWCPTGSNLERLPDGRAYPSVIAVQRVFSAAGLELSIKHNLVFGCFRATWSPAGEKPSEDRTDDRHGTVIGSCDREAAVYALAQFRDAQNQLLRDAEPISSNWTASASLV